MKTYISLILAAALLLSLSGCGAPQGSVPEAIPEETAPDAALPSSVSWQEEKDGQTLTIQADVECGDAIPDKMYTLTFDQDARQRLFDALIEDPADLAHEDEQGRTVGITFDTELHHGSPLGDIYFEDHRKTDWNEKSLDQEKFWDPGYFSPMKPGNFQISSREAAGEMAEFLSGYSCLDYVPARAEAREGADGAYYIHFSATFRDLNILSRDMPGLSGQIRESGMEAFQGTLLLKEADSQAISDPLTFQQALARLKTDFFESSYAKNLTIERILCCYTAMPGDDSWRLSPAWVFLGQETGGYIDPYGDYHMPDSLPAAYVYDMNDGFLDILDANHLHDFS